LAFTCGLGSSFGGVRELRFSAFAGTGLGISRRVTKPWPVVHRFVVSQYTIRPAGKLRMNGMNTIGRTSSRIRCAFCIELDM
jgi:hypothetical protein